MRGDDYLSGNCMNEGERRSMLKQQVMAAVSRHVRLPLWRRLMLITALLLPGEALVAVISIQAAHASNIMYIVCYGGNGGVGGVAFSTNGDGARGGNGGDCLIYSAKGGGGGTAGANGASGGTVIYQP